MCKQTSAQPRCLQLRGGGQAGPHEPLQPLRHPATPNQLLSRCAAGAATPAPYHSRPEPLASPPPPLAQCARCDHARRVIAEGSIPGGSNIIGCCRRNGHANRCSGRSSCCRIDRSQHLGLRQGSAGGGCVSAAKEAGGGGGAVGARSCKQRGDRGGCTSLASRWRTRLTHHSRGSAAAAAAAAGIAAVDAGRATGSASWWRVMPPR